MWRTYPEEGVTPESYRNTQKLADTGHVSRLMELYDAMANDYHIGSQLRTRKLAVAGAPLLAEPGDKSDAAKRIAEDFNRFWSDIPDPSQLLFDLLDDFYRGFSCVRPVWDSIANKWQIVDSEAIESRYFYFADGKTPLITPCLLYTSDAADERSSVD